jgi:hypothetical protein
MSKLNIQVGEVEEAVQQHAESTRGWQRMSGERLHAIKHGTIATVGGAEGLLLVDGISPSTVVSLN